MACIHCLDEILSTNFFCEIDSCDCRCGQRWAKLGKCSTPESIRISMSGFVHPATCRGGISLDSTYKKRRRSHNEPSPSDSKKHHTKDFASPGSRDRYIGYAVKKLSDGKASYALFWLMDAKNASILVAIGVDARSSGHFIYQKSPLLPDSVPILHCTNRYETFKWIQENFHVTKALAASLKAKIPNLGIEQLEYVLEGRSHETARRHEKYRDAQQHLCSICGCNHPTEECPTAESSAAGLILNEMHSEQKHSRSDDQEIIDPFGPIPADFDLGHDVLDILPTDGISPIGDHIFASPKEDTPRSMEVFMHQHTCSATSSPESLAHPTNIQLGHVGKAHILHSSPDTSSQCLLHTSPTISMENMDSVLKTWTKILEDFDMGHSFVKPEDVMDVLQHLLACKTLSLQQLSRSRILIPVSKLCTHTNPMVSSASRHVVDIWRSLAVVTINSNISTSGYHPNNAIQQ